MGENTRDRSADIIIPVCNRFDYTRALLEGIYRYSDIPFQIYIIDNASTDGTADLHKIYTRDITIVRNLENRGWCGGINQGFQMGSNPYVVFMKNDAEVSQGWLGNLLSFLDTHPWIGAVSPLTSNPRDRHFVDRVRENLVPQIPHFFTQDLHERCRILSYHFHRAGILVDGSLPLFCTALMRRTVTAVGPLDETLAGSEDDDYCRRLREAGYVLGLSLDTYILHHSGAIEGEALDGSPSRKSRNENLIRSR